MLFEIAMGMYSNYESIITCNNYTVTRGYSDSTYKSNWNVNSIVEIAPLALLYPFAYSAKTVACTTLKQRPTCPADDFLCNSTKLQAPRVSASL